MQTYIIKSRTCYGEVVHIINAESEGETRKIADGCDEVWAGYEIELLDTQTPGIVFVGGGE